MLEAWQTAMLIATNCSGAERFNEALDLITGGLGSLQKLNFLLQELRAYRRSHDEQRDYGAPGTDRRREPSLSSTQDARMGRTYGKCRVNMLRND